MITQGRFAGNICNKTTYGGPTLDNASHPIRQGCANDWSLGHQWFNIPWLLGELFLSTFKGTATRNFKCTLSSIWVPCGNSYLFSVLLFRKWLFNVLFLIFLILINKDLAYNICNITIYGEPILGNANHPSRQGCANEWSLGHQWFNISWLLGYSCNRQSDCLFSSLTIVTHVYTCT